MKFKPFMSHTETTIVLIMVGSGLYVIAGAEHFPRWVARFWPSISIGGALWYVLRCAFPRRPKGTSDALDQKQSDTNSDSL